MNDLRDEAVTFDERIRGFPVGVRVQEADDEFCSFTLECRKDRVIFGKHPNRPWPQMNNMGLERWIRLVTGKISCTDYRGWYDCYTVCGRGYHEYPHVCKTGGGNLPESYRWKWSIWESEYCIAVKNESGRCTNIGVATLICANNEPKTVLAWLWRLSW